MCGRRKGFDASQDGTRWPMRGLRGRVLKRSAKMAATGRGKRRDEHTQPDEEAYVSTRGVSSLVAVRIFFPELRCARRIAIYP